MKTLKNAIGGLAGAAVLNIVHQTLKKFTSNAPRIALIGEEALNKGLKIIGTKPLKGDALFAYTLAADLLSNAAYYSLTGLGKRKNLLTKGTALGFAAGAGALLLTRRMGLNDAPIKKSTETKLLTVVYYLIGGIVAALTINALTQKKRLVNTPSNTDEEGELIGNS